MAFGVPAPEGQYLILKADGIMGSHNHVSHGSDEVLTKHNLPTLREALKRELRIEDKTATSSKRKAA